MRLAVVALVALVATPFDVSGVHGQSDNDLWSKLDEDPMEAECQSALARPLVYRPKDPVTGAVLPQWECTESPVRGTSTECVSMHLRELQLECEGALREFIPQRGKLLRQAAHCSLATCR